MNTEVPLTIKQAFEKDRRIAVSDWVIKPSETLVTEIMRKSVSFKTAVELNAKAQDLLSRMPTPQADLTYLINAYGCVADDLMQRNLLNENQKLELERLDRELQEKFAAQELVITEAKKYLSGHRQ